MMNPKSLNLILGLLLSLAACAPVSTLRPTATDEPPTATAAPPTATSQPTATQAPSGPHAVTFTATDGATLSGTLYGNGTVAVIFSNMGDKHEDSWAKVAQAVADEGYLTLTYEFRYWVNGKIQESLVKHVGEDLQAAADFVRAQGAEQVVLVGASMGGMATAKTAANAQASAAIILAAPLDASVVGVVVEVEDELRAITAPKLFITSENDKTVKPEALQTMYELAVEPKELALYPGTAHGTDLFQTASGPELQKKILEFIQTHAPAR
ncbi:MAG: dienelactone hydrolase family protein [Anaerolineales bacterium]|nr:dienelactone hydrolase family protein [Anaerolineales bacterium]